MTYAQALERLGSDDLLGLGMEADALRQELHPEGVVSYSIDGTIHWAADAAGSGVSSARGLERMYQGIGEALAMGCTGVTISTGRQPEITACEQLLTTLRQRFHGLALHGFSASVIAAAARNSGASLSDTVLRLRDAGLGSLAGADALILNDEFRQRIAPLLCSTEDWLAVHRIAHTLGMRSTAAITFGVGESLEQRMHHLDLIRRLQDETGGFIAFLPWTLPPVSTSISVVEQPTAVDALKLLAVSRLYLANIPNVQATWATQGLKVLQMALRFGANDAGFISSETASAQGTGTTEETLRRIIRDAGFKPAQRDTLYTSLLLG